MEESSPQDRVKNLVGKFAKNWGLKKRSKYFKRLKEQTLDALEEHEDLNGQTPKQFAQDLINDFLDGVPERIVRTWKKHGGVPIEKKKYSEYKFKDETVAKRNARRAEKEARKAALTEYRNYDKDQKREHNLRHGRYGAGKKERSTQSKV